MRVALRIFKLFLCAGLTVSHVFPARASSSHASGGGTYFVEPDVRSEFQFNKAHVQCKIGHAVLPDGTTLQMYMASLSIQTTTIDSAAKTVLITGTMVSIVRLRFTNQTSTTLTETVPFVAYAEDNGTPGAGTDFFSLAVQYTPTAGFDQADLFGANATFSGTLETGKVEVQ
jgi:hypothetical protein